MVRKHAKSPHLLPLLATLWLPGTGKEAHVSPGQHQPRAGRLPPPTLSRAPRSGAVGPEALCLSASLLPSAGADQAHPCQSVLPEKCSERADARLEDSQSDESSRPRSTAPQIAAASVWSIGVRGKGSERRARGGHRRPNGKVLGPGIWGSRFASASGKLAFQREAQ